MCVKCSPGRKLNATGYSTAHSRLRSDKSLSVEAFSAHLGHGHLSLTRVVRVVSGGLATCLVLSS